MEILHMKISDLLLDPHLDFLRFPKHKTGWGVRYPGRCNSLSCHPGQLDPEPGYLAPHPEHFKY